MRVRWSSLWSVAVLVVAAVLVMGTLTARADSPNSTGTPGADSPVLKVTATVRAKVTPSSPAFDPGPTAVYLRLNAAGDDMKAAKKALLERTAALEKGLTAAGLSLQPMFSSATAGDPYGSSYGPPYGMAPGPGMTSQPKVYVNATLVAWATTREQVLTAIQIGAENGALSAGTEHMGAGVYSSMTMSFSGSEPTTAQLGKAVEEATARAKELATVQAKAAGVTLGKLKSIQTEPAPVCCGPADAREISVTLTYATAP